MIDKEQLSEITSLVERRNSPDKLLRSIPGIDRVLAARVPWLLELVEKHQMTINIGAMKFRDTVAALQERVRELETTRSSQFLEVIKKQCSPNFSGSPEELHVTWIEAYLAMGWVYVPIYSRENKIHLTS